MITETHLGAIHEGGVIVAPDEYFVNSWIDVPKLTVTDIFYETADYLGAKTEQIDRIHPTFMPKELMADKDRLAYCMPVLNEQDEDTIEYCEIAIDFTREGLYASIKEKQEVHTHEEHFKALGIIGPVRHASSTCKLQTPEQLLRWAMAEEMRHALGYLEAGTFTQFESIREAYAMDLSKQGRSYPHPYDSDIHEKQGAQAALTSLIRAYRIKDPGQATYFEAVLRDALTRDITPLPNPSRVIFETYRKEKLEKERMGAVDRI